MNVALLARMYGQLWDASKFRANGRAQEEVLYWSLYQLFETLSKKVWEIESREQTETSEERFNANNRRYLQYAFEETIAELKSTLKNGSLFTQEDDKDIYRMALHLLKGVKSYYIDYYK